MRRSLGSAGRGAGEWLVQRVTSMYAALFVLVLLARFVIAPISSYAALRAWWSSPFVRATSALFVGSVLLHAWIGLRSVFIDYIRPTGLRVAAYLAAAAGLAYLAVRAAMLLLNA